MLRGVVVAALLCAPLPAAAEQVVNVTTNRPMPLVISRPGTGASVLRTSALLDAWARRFETLGLDLRLASESLVTECEGALACLVARLEPEAPFVLLTTVAGRAPNEVVVVTLLDVEKVRAIVAAGDEVELRIEAQAALTTEREVGAPEALDRFIEAAWRETYLPALAKAGHVPLAEVRVDAPPETTLRFDDAEHVTTHASVRFRRVPPGSHRLDATHAQHGTWSQTVELEPGASVELTVPSSRPDDRAKMNPILRWGGAGVATLGAGLVVGSLFLDRGVYVFDDSGASMFARTGGSSGVFEDPNTGLPLAPIGLALVGFGATVAITNLLFSEDPPLPLFEFVAGAVVGGLTLAMTLALDPDPVTLGRSSP
ncbi:MAG: hypothetical protein RIT81_17335 [Deltaproteobacteria bacterium]